jgi:hypothetical protein
MSRAARKRSTGKLLKSQQPKAAHLAPDRRSRGCGSQRERPPTEDGCQPQRHDFRNDAHLILKRLSGQTLRDIFIGKLPVRDPTPRQGVTFFQDPLDDDKKAAN